MSSKRDDAKAGSYIPEDWDVRKQLRLDVALMRELGVTEWNGIKLGPLPPAPTKPPTPEEQVERMKERERARLATQFAASSVRPTFKMGEE